MLAHLLAADGWSYDAFFLVVFVGPFISFLGTKRNARVLMIFKIIYPHTPAKKDNMPE